jgi:DNA repair exonuclease SbcCD ATPase subunit
MMFVTHQFDSLLTLFTFLSILCYPYREQYEQSKALLDMQASQLSIWPDRVAELERKNANLDDELETSKRLFETKSIEAESLKLRLSELERSIYETEQAAGAQAGDLDAYRRDVAQLRKELSERSRDLRKRDMEIKDAMKERAEALEALEKRGLDMEKEKSQVAELIQKLNRFEEKEDEWTSKFKQAEVRSLNQILVFSEFNLYFKLGTAKVD